MIAFTEFHKIPRLFRDCVITEKIDGTNASVLVVEGPVAEDDPKVVAVVGTLAIYAGSRTRWITRLDDNFGFAGWVQDHAVELAQLGVGHHFGEWWGQGIQRKYGQDRKRFSLFNTSRWCGETIPACCDLVPVLYSGHFTTDVVNQALDRLRTGGSLAAPGFMKPEGVVVYHIAAGRYFKVTLEKDEAPKGRLT